MLVAALVAALVAGIPACTSSAGSSAGGSDARRAAVQLLATRGTEQVGGSGVIVDAKRRLVLTSAHVVAGASGLSAVVEGVTVTAHVVASAPCEDVAVVTLDTLPKGAAAASLGSSAHVRAGDTVTSLGFPDLYKIVGEDAFWRVLQAPVRVTTGAVAAPRVAVEPDNSLPRFPEAIQHSAPMNQGSAGGPLLDSGGSVVGLNGVGDERTGEMRVQGQYFAISIDRVRSLLKELESGHGTADAGWDLGPFAKLSLSAVFKSDGYASSNVGVAVDGVMYQHGVDGVFVYGVTDGSAAARAGVAGGDLVTNINGTPVATVDDVCKLFRPAAPGASFQLDGYRLTSPSADPNGLPAQKSWSLTLG